MNGAPSHSMYQFQSVNSSAHLQQKVHAPQSVQSHHNVLTPQPTQQSAQETENQRPLQEPLGKDSNTQQLPQQPLQNQIHFQQQQQFQHQTQLHQLQQPSHYPIQRFPQYYTPVMPYNAVGFPMQQALVQPPPIMNSTTNHPPQLAQIHVFSHLANDKHITASSNPPSSGTNTSAIGPVPSSTPTTAAPIHSSDEPLTIDEIIGVLTVVNPSTVKEYSEHAFKVATLLHEQNRTNALSPKNFVSLQQKFYSLMDDLEKFVNVEDPINQKLYLIIERNFDLFIKISTNDKNVDISIKTIRFLTNIIMHLNYWEIYNLLSWKPAIIRFLEVIRFDFNDCYKRFITDYAQYNYKKISQPDVLSRKIRARRKAKRALELAKKKASAKAVAKASAAAHAAHAASAAAYHNSNGKKYKGKSGKAGTPGSDGVDEGYSMSSPYFENDFIVESLTPKERKKLRQEGKLVAHRIVKKENSMGGSSRDIPQSPTGDLLDSKGSNKSSNYDPDVVHECDLASADEPNKPCLRRFSRKYELIRHQETVHSKKKKLFKCYVCVKQNPGVGPRIFTRHDTLAKHIRVNHKISGKEAKAEVAYSKKHAEIVEEGDITVHVGRRKTKVDFELRAHMEKKKMSKGYQDGDDESGYVDTNSEMESGDEEIMYEN